LQYGIDHVIEQTVRYPARIDMCVKKQAEIVWGCTLVGTLNDIN